MYICSKSRLRPVFIAAALILAAASCGEKPAQEDELVPITFCADGGGMQISTKAGAVLKSNSDFLTGGQQFALFGTWTIVSNGTSANIFTKQLVSGTYDSANSRYNCSYSPLRYWQKSGMYYFRAIYPATANTQGTSNGRSIISNYTMTTDDFDLMVANSTPRDASLNDYSKVPLVFRHALAAVKFVFQKGTRGASVNYYLDSFELQYLQAIGSLVFVSTDQDAKLDSQWWLVDDFRPSSLYAWSGKVPVPTYYSSFPGSGSAWDTWEEWHCVLPQSMHSSNPDETPRVRFSSTILTGSTYSEPSYTTIELPTTYTYTDSNSVEHTEDVVWEAGKMYTYYIQIQPGGATINVSIRPWDEYKVAVEDLNF